jgi:hypothetical protein
VSAVVIMFRGRRAADRKAPLAYETSRVGHNARGHRESAPSSPDTKHAPPPPPMPAPPGRLAEGSAGAVSRIRELAVDGLALLMLARELLRRSAVLLERARAGR